MKHLLLLFVFGSLILTGCQKESFNIDVNQELQGQWEYERVKFVCGSSSNDLTDDYEYKVIKFEGDQISLNHNNYENFWVGKFSASGERIEIVEDPDPFCDDFDEDTFNDCDCEITYETKRYMDAELKEMNTNYSMVMSWKEFTYENNKIEYSESRDGGTYYYRLKRI